MTAPHRNFIAPHGTMTAPHRNFIAPHGTMTAPHQNFTAPCGTMTAPHRNFIAPHGTMTAPHQNFIAPCGTMTAPHQNFIAPHGTKTAPHHPKTSQSVELQYLDPLSPPLQRLPPPRKQPPAFCDIGFLQQIRRWSTGCAWTVGREYRAADVSITPCVSSPDFPTSGW